MAKKRFTASELKERRRLRERERLRKLRQDPYKYIEYKLKKREWYRRFKEKEKGKEIQKKWKSLRDAYHRSLRLQLECNENGMPLKKPYIYSDLMNFLTPRYRNHIVIDNLHYEDGEEEPINTEVVYTTYEDEEEAVAVEEEELEVKPSPANIMQRPKRRKQTNPRVNVLNESSQSFTSMMLQQDPDNLFFLSLVPKMKKLKESALFDFQIKCMQLLQSYLENPDYIEAKPSSAELFLAN